MKKLLLLFLLVAGGVSTASAADKWVGASCINVNGTWYRASEHKSNGWAYEAGGNFNGHDFETVTSLTIGGQSQVYDNGNSWGESGTMLMKYRIDDGDEHSITLNCKGFADNNNIFQSGGSWGTENFSTETIDITNLSSGSHNLVVWFVSYDINGQNGVYDSNGGSNFVATFTIPDNQSVTVGSDGYATYVSPYRLDYTSTAIKAYTAKVNTSTGEVVLSQINKVQGGVPVILHCAGDNTEDIPVATAIDTPVASDLVAGTGSTVPTTDGAGNYNYILNNSKGIGFYKANDQTVATNRAYLHTTYNVASPGARLSIVFADETTGINNLTPALNDGTVYDLQGRRVAQPAKGLYIINGKKVIK